MLSLSRVAILSPLLLLAVSAWAADSLPEKHRPVEPFLNSQTIVLAWLDLNNADPIEAWSILAETTKDAGAADLIPTIKMLQSTLLNNDCSMVYAVAELPELFRGQLRLIFPTSKPDALKNILAGFAPNQSVTVQNQCVVLAHSDKSAVPESNTLPTQELIDAVTQNSQPIGLAMAAGDSIRQLLPVWKTSFKPKRSSDQAIFDHLQAMRSFVIGVDTKTFAGNAVLTMQDAKAAENVRPWLIEFAEERLRRPLQLKMNVSGRSVEVNATNREQFLIALNDVRAVIEKGAERSNRINDFKQTMLAFHNFHSAYKRLPPQALSDDAGNKLLSWRVALLPFLGEAELWKKFHLDEPWDSAHNKPLIKEMPKVFAGSLPAEEGKTTIVAPLTPDSAIGRPGTSTQFRDITDGLSNTMAIANTAPDSAVIWSKPDDVVFDAAQWRTQFISPGEDGFIATMWDGSVHYLPAKIKSDSLTKMLSIDGKEVIDRDEFQLK